MSKINVLIPEAGGAVALAIIECLRMVKGYRIITMDIDPEMIGVFRGDIGYIVPKKWDLYYKKMQEIIKKEKIDILIPSHEIALSHFVRVPCDIPTIIDSKMVSIARNKYKTAEWLRKNNFPYPKIWKYIEDVEEYPVIIKPKIGTGSSKGVYKAYNEMELECLLSLCRRDGWIPIIQECLQGTEYTNMACNSIDKEVLSTTITSVIKKSGMSFKLTVLKENPMNEEVRKIAEKLNVAGPINMQGIETEKGFTIFEINARFSGTQATRAYAGVNGPDILVRNWLFGEKEYPKVKKSIRAFFFRSYVYIDDERWKKLVEKKVFSREGDISHWL